MPRTVRNMSDEDILVVLQIIDGWTHDTLLTWDALIEAIQQRLFKKWSRQALDRHERIKKAYTDKRNSLRRGVAPPNEEHLPADLRKANETIRRLRSENERLERENNDLMEKFRVWSANAVSMGMSEEKLNAALPPIDHGSSRDER